MDSHGIHEEPLTWTPEARARLDQVPAGPMSSLTRQRVEALARRLGLPTVTLDLVETKYRQWAEGSAQAVDEMTWTEEARRRTERIPPFVRGMVVKAVEAYAASKGLTEITPAILDEAKGSWGDSGRFHGP